MGNTQKKLSPDMQDFINGLKLIIRTSWPTQEEFAKTVTSKVNMSNILRGYVGTSKAMRQALAKRAGKSIEEIIAIGQMASNGDMTARSTVSATPTEYTGGSSAELLSIAGEHATNMQNELAFYTKNLTTLLSDVLTERDKLTHLVSQEQAIANSLTAAILVVNSDMRITYVNRPMMEQFMVYPKDSVGSNNCPFCKEIEKLVNKVFNKEGISRGMVTHDGVLFCITACPIMSYDWAVDRVTVAVFSADPFIDMLKEMGWTPPS